MQIKKIFKPKKWCLLLAMPILVGKCKKENTDDGLPLLTFVGANTIGCKINGVPWVPKGISGLGGILYPVDGGHYINPFFPGAHILIETNNPEGYIELFCRNYAGTGLIPPGKYYFNKKTEDIIFGNGEIHSYAYYHTNGKNYFTDSLYTGWIEFLRVGSVISGKFTFDCYNSNDGKTYHITEGRFDIK